MSTCKSCGANVEDKYCQYCGAKNMDYAEENSNETLGASIINKEAVTELGNIFKKAIIAGKKAFNELKKEVNEETIISKKCKNCGSDNDAESKYCAKCGLEL